MLTTGNQNWCHEIVGCTFSHNRVTYCLSKLSSDEDRPIGDYENNNVT